MTSIDGFNQIISAFGYVKQASISNYDKLKEYLDITTESNINLKAITANLEAVPGSTYIASAAT